MVVGFQSRPPNWRCGRVPAAVRARKSKPSRDHALTTCCVQMYEDLMYKELLSLGYMRDVPTEEVSWPWPLHLQGQRSTPIAAEKVGCRRDLCTARTSRAAGCPAPDRAKEKVAADGRQARGAHAR